MKLKNRIFINIYRLFDRYIKEGHVWKDHQSFQFFVIRCNRALKDYFEDYMVMKNKMVEHLEYEKKVVELLNVYNENQDKDLFESSMKELNEEYKDCEDNKQIEKFLDEDFEVTLPTLPMNEVPPNLPINELSIFFDLLTE